MAIMRTIYCHTCGETKQECCANGDYPNECGECKAKAAKQKRAAFLAGRAALTVEERLTLIEQWIYDHKAHVDINSVLY